MQFSSMSSLGSSMRRWKSSMFSNTSARARCVISFGVAAQHRDAGVFLERRLEAVDHLAIPARRVLVVLPDRLAADRERVAVQQVVFAQLPQHGRHAAGV